MTATTICNGTDTGMLLFGTLTYLEKYKTQLNDKKKNTYIYSYQWITWIF